MVFVHSCSDVWFLLSFCPSFHSDVTSANASESENVTSINNYVILCLEEPDIMSNESLDFFAESKQMILELLQLPGAGETNISRWNYTVDNVIVNMYNASASVNVIDTTVTNRTGNRSAWDLALAIRNLSVNFEQNLSMQSAAVNASIPLELVDTQLQHLRRFQAAAERINATQPACMMLSQSGFKVSRQDLQLSANVQSSSELFVVASNSSISDIMGMAQLTSNPAGHLYFVEQAIDIAELSGVVKSVVQSGECYETI